ALEFLTTYGWAFLIILVMIGAFAYFDILNPQRLFPGKCQFQVGMTCDQYKIANPAGDNPYVQFELKNQKGGSIWIKDIEYYNPQTGDYTNCLDRTTGADHSGFGTHGAITNELEEAAGDGIAIAPERIFDLTCEFDETNVEAVAGDKATVKVRYWYNDGATEDLNYQKPMQGSIVADVTES
ncbi:hypothetical protein KY327_02165, partial [Candidatus Woesearchaeota archaeon]|nr:hypothetical protein [Candidatus Woesearchaeota archaeon]